MERSIYQFLLTYVVLGLLLFIATPRREWARRRRTTDAPVLFVDLVLLWPANVLSYAYRAVKGLD